MARVFSELDNIVLFMVISKVGWMIRILGDGNFEDVKGINLKERVKENIGME